MEKKKALLVIDIQEDYTGQTAKPPFPYQNAEQLIVTVNSVIDKAVKKNFAVIYIKQEFSGFMGPLISILFGHGTAMKGKPGRAIDKRVKLVSEHCFSKALPDAFSNAELRLFIKENNIDELYLVGLDAQWCVFATAKGGLKQGCNVSIIKDGLGLLAQEKWDSLLEKYKQKGISLLESKDF